VERGESGALKPPLSLGGGEPDQGFAMPLTIGCLDFEAWHDDAFVSAFVAFPAAPDVQFETGDVETNRAEDPARGGRAL
jgi:hypothetical protein